MTLSTGTKRAEAFHTCYERTGVQHTSTTRTRESGPPSARRGSSSSVHPAADPGVLSGLGTATSTGGSPSICRTLMASPV